MNTLYGLAIISDASGGPAESLHRHVREDLVRITYHREHSDGPSHTGVIKRKTGSGQTPLEKGV